MVQVAADPAWTLEALHCAAVMAREQSATIALVKMIPVQHLSWLGTDMGYINLTEKEEQEIADYAETLEDYGVAYDLYPFQYATLADAIVQAAEHLKAQVVFATVPNSVIPFWRSYQLRDLRRHFAQAQRQFIEHPAYARVPATAPRMGSVVAEA
jgi:hypothetical protein